MDRSLLIQKLTESGFAPLDLDDDGIASSVRAFQDAHALVIDGIVGPKTSAALLSPPASPKGCFAPGWRYEEGLVRPELRPVLAAGIAEVGVREDPPGSNRGPRVDDFTRPLFGIPWCAAFVSWCYARRAGGSPFGRINGTRDLVEWGRKMGRLVSGEPPQPGDIGFIPTTPSHGHVFLVAHPGDEKGICTVEGNSGDAVWGRLRRWSTVQIFIRPVA